MVVRARAATVPISNEAGARSSAARRAGLGATSGPVAASRPGSRYVVAVILLLLACDDPRVSPIEARLAALESEVAALESEVAAVGAAHGRDAAQVAVVPGTRELVPVLDEAQAVACAFDALQSVASAEAGHDAAFDAYLSDLEKLGWSIDPSRGCHAYLTVSVALSENARGRVDNFVATAVLTHGPGAGRRFRIDRSSRVTEVAD